jgi:hypothetical protein
MERAVRLMSSLVVAGILMAPRAKAQSVEVSKVLHRKQAERPGYQKPRWVNRADCIARDVFTFSVALRDYDGYTLQVWAGDRGIDCAQKENRQTGSDSECWLVFGSEADEPTMSVDVSAVDLVAREAPAKKGAEARVVHGSTDVCTDSDADNGVPLGLHFMLVDSAGRVQGDAQVWSDIGYDVVPPAAPTNVTASSGETRLFVDWTAPKQNDVRSYVLYCDSAPNAVYDAEAPVRTRSFADTAEEAGAVIDPDAAIAPSNTSADAAGAVDAATSRTSSPTDDADDAGAAGTCARWSDLLPGADPVSPRSLARYVCGSAGASDRSATLDHLANDLQYVVAVAALDDSGNVGTLSDQVCETPVEITDFFELYRQAGGKAGGGICSIARPGTYAGASVPIASVAALFAVAALRVRRRYRRRR